MTETTTTEIVEPDEKVVIKQKDLEVMIAKAIVNIEKKDYRATVTHIDQKGQVPDAMTAFINIDEGAENKFGFNRELDIKGSINPFQLYFSQTARFAQALQELKNWEYIERKDENGNIVKIDVDLMTLESEEMRWLSLALFGQQSEKEIRLMRAGFGLNEENVIDRGAKWFGLIKKKKREVYQQQQ